MDISAYFTTQNQAQAAIGPDEVVHSYLSFAQEVVVCDRNSSDGTWDELRLLASREPRLRLLRCQESAPDHEASQVARRACRGRALFEGASTIVVDDHDSGAFGDVVALLSSAWPAIALPILSYRGSCEHVRRDLCFSRPALSLNEARIVHTSHGLVDRSTGLAIPCLEILPAALEAARHDARGATELTELLERHTSTTPVLWSHASMRESLPAHRLPSGLVPTPQRHDPVLRPQLRPSEGLTPLLPLR